MRRAERVAILETLLARVQANADARPRSGAIAGAAVPGGEVPRAAATATPAVAARAAAAPPPRDPHRAEDLGDWSSLLERDLRDPSPASMPPPSHASVRPASLATPRIATVPPPPAGRSEGDDPIDPHGPSAPITPSPVEQAAPHSRPLHAAAPQPPDSEIRRAIRDAAGPPATDPRGLWVEAASDLRERRPSLPAAAPSELSAPPAAGPEPDPVPALDGPMPASILATAAPIPEARLPPSPLDTPSPRPRRARQGARKRRIVLPVASAAAIVAAALVWAMEPRSPFDRVASPAVTASPSRPSGHAPPAAPAASPSGPSVHPPEAPSAASPGSAPRDLPRAPSVVATAPSETPVAPDPAPPIRRPRDHGLLRVDAGDTVDVYLQGVRAGASGTWIEVPCGPKNVRLARAGAAPPGHSFPLWLGEGRTLQVGCGTSHPIRWSFD